MIAQAFIVAGAVPNSAGVDGPVVPGAGAVVSFDGIVRALEEGRPLLALEYEVYQPMAERELERLGLDVGARHGLLRLAAWHSRGRVAVGETSFRLVVWSARRAEGLAGMAEFIDRLKRDIPIWKQPVWKLSVHTTL